MNRFDNIDCMIGMAEYEDNHFDLAIVDPPYGINVAKMAYTQEDLRPCKQKNGSVLTVKGKKYKHGDWDKVPPDVRYFVELKRISKNQIIWGINHFTSYVKNFGVGRIIWDKCVPDGVSFSGAEIAYCSLQERVSIFKYLWSGFSQGISALKGEIQRGNKKLNEKRIHPTQKPIALYKWLLTKYAKQGDLILDTHVGSASSLIACEDMDFNYVGFELDEDYYNSAQKRLTQFRSQFKLKL